MYDINKCECNYIRQRYLPKISSKIKIFTLVSYINKLGLSCVELMLILASQLGILGQLQASWNISTVLNLEIYSLLDQLKYVSPLQISFLLSEVGWIILITLFCMWFQLLVCFLKACIPKISFLGSFTGTIPGRAEGCWIFKN